MCGVKTSQLFLLLKFSRQLNACIKIIFVDKNKYIVQHLIPRTWCSLFITPTKSIISYRLLVL